VNNGRVFRSNLFVVPWLMVMSALSLLGAAAQAEDSAAAFPVTVRVDAGISLGRLKPIWRFFGADEPNYAYMKDGRKLLSELGELRPGEVFFRTHNLLNTGDGTPALKWGSTNIYTEDDQGRPVYDWRIVDLIFDTYLQRGVRPYVQLGFMPRALSSRPEPYKHEWRPGFPYEEVYTGWAYPPKDYAKWSELIYQWVKHCLEKFGRPEVEKWYWETWNEANIPYWQGTPEEFRKLHDYTVDAVRRALPTARVGGPDMAGSDPAFLKDFLEHCLRGVNHATGRKGTPIDFISFHAKGAPKFIGDHVQMGIAAQLRTIDRGFATIAAYPELKQLPIVIGESDPEGCAACQGSQLAYRNGTMYSSYTAASFARKHDLADRHGVNLEGALTWAFTFEDQPYFAGFRQLASNGVDLPVLNVFRMFAKMGGDRIAATSTGAVSLDEVLAEGVRKSPDVGALASRAGETVCLMLWHYHDDDLPGPQAAVDAQVSGLPEGKTSVTMTHYRIDEKHSNAYATWMRMGSPVAPNRKQYAELEAAGRLNAIGKPDEIPVSHGSMDIRFSLPRQGVSLLVIE